MSDYLILSKQSIKKIKRTNIKHKLTHQTLYLSFWKVDVNTPIIISEKIIAKNKDKPRFLINADNIFLNESFQQIKSSYSSKFRGFRLGNLSKTKTRYNKIRNYPENTDVVVNYFFESKYPTKRGG